jgi:hypothetical protein
MAHLEEVQVVECNNGTGIFNSVKTADCPSGLYSDLEQSELMKVRQLKLQEYLEAKQRFDEVETEVRTRAWRRSLKDKGDDLQSRIERQRLEAEALGVFSKNEGGVRGAPRDSSFGSKRRTSRVQSKPLDESAVLAFLASLEVD